MDDDTPLVQEMLNPLTKQWERMTTREWWLYRLGFTKDRHAEVDDWTFNFLRGPEAVCHFAFGLDSSYTATVKWLVGEYKKAKIRSAQDAYKWSQFMLFAYPIRDMEPALRIGFEIIEAKKDEIKCLFTQLQEATSPRASARSGTRKRR